MTKWNEPNNYYKYIVVAVTLFICLACVLRVNYDFLFAERTYTQDISVANSYRNNKSYDVYLVSYADGGEIHLRNQNTLAQTAINKGFDNILLYGRKNLDKKFLEKNKHILNEPKGAGYWAWKPYVILDAMSKAKENDVIIYLDSGIIVTNKLKDGIGSLLRNIEMFDKDIIVFPNNHKIRPYVKRDLLEHFNMNNDEYKNKHQMVGGVVIFKNTQIARNFVSEWLILCEQEKLISDKPSALQEDPEFEAHRHDQSILSLLTYKYPSNVQIFPVNYMEWFPHHRRRSVNIDRTLFIDWDRSF